MLSYFHFTALRLAQKARVVSHLHHSINFQNYKARFYILWRYFVIYRIYAPTI
ncbi:hypothetical protein [Helicobacter jaachi]|uniref:hypothetical protein n=1 Tax=Helicobacter jaachi TaxID=1677920 RepID=UPI000AEAFE37|nr:hypothetical protein [Helicobacter jaachi]